MGNNYLLDTHCLIWFQDNSYKIPNKVFDIIKDPSNTIYFSQISLFEIVIKQKIGKLPLFTASVDEVYKQSIIDGLDYLEINNNHLFNYNRIPLFEQHRDPFDRLLLATAFTENLIIISIDESFGLYKDIVTVFW